MVKVHHLLDVPRLGKSQAGDKWPTWNGRRQRPARPRLPQTMKLYGGWLRKHGHVPRRRQAMKSIDATEYGMTGSIMNSDDVADVQQQRAPSTAAGRVVDVCAEVFEPFIRSRSKLFPPPVQLGRQAAQ